MHKSNYQPKRSQQLFLAQKVREKLNYPGGTVVVHHVLEDTPTRLYLQIEHRFNLNGVMKISFERIEL